MFLTQLELENDQPWSKHAVELSLIIQISGTKKDKYDDQKKGKHRFSCCVQEPKIAASAPPQSGEGKAVEM